MTSNDKYAGRIPRIEVETGTEEQVTAIREILEARGKWPDKMGNLFSMMVTSPEVARRLAIIGEQVRYYTDVPEMCREAAILSACYERDFPYDAKPHEEIALHRGMPKEQLTAIQEKKFDALPREISIASRFARAIASMEVVPQSLFNEVQQQFGNVGLLDLALTATYYVTLNMMANVLQPALDGAGEALYRPKNAP